MLAGWDLKVMSESVNQLREIVRRLRAPDGCPWDREQTHESLRAALIEECYEAVDAINRADDTNLCEELGDLLLLVIMHAEMGNERGAFHFDEVASAVCEKLVRRHPHVFGDAQTGDTDKVLKQWEEIKRQERGAQSSVLDGIPEALPALMRAQNTQKKMARVGFDWNEVAPIFEKIEEEIGELREEISRGEARRTEEEMGDLLFSVVNLSRKLKIDAEGALMQTTDKVGRRFRRVEELARLDGRQVEEMSLEELDKLWDRTKEEEKIA